MVEPSVESRVIREHPDHAADTAAIFSQRPSANPDVIADALDRLYEFLQQYPDAEVELLSALRDCSQSGNLALDVAKILEDYSHQNGVTLPNHIPFASHLQTKPPCRSAAGPLHAAMGEFRHHPAEYKTVYKY